MGDGLNRASAAAPFRILVTGSRDWDDAHAVRFAIEAASLDARGREVVVVHGANGNADLMADQAARDLGFTPEPHHADWEAPCRPECRPGHRRRNGRGRPFCPAAGNYRNQEMCDGGADAAVALFQPGAPNKGTSDCTRRAVAAGIPVTPYGDVPAAITALLQKVQARP